MNRFYISLLALATALPALAQENGDEGGKLKLVGSVQSDILIPQEDKKIGTGSYKEWARTNTFAELHLMSKYVEAGTRFEFTKHPLPGFEKDYGFLQIIQHKA